MDPVQDERTALLPFLNILRVTYIDNLRTFLTILLIYHHTAIGYGGYGLWAYSSPYHTSSRTLIAFTVVNEAFVGGLFFFISGHCSTMALGTKSSRQFVHGKLLRLGLPAIVYLFIVEPLLALLLIWYKREIFGSIFFRYYWRSLRGPVWYLVLLLCFDLAYMLLRSAPSSLTFMRITSAKRYRIVASSSIAVLIIYSIFTRSGLIKHWFFNPLDLRLSFPPLEYVLAYVAGVHFPTIEHYLVSSRPVTTLIVSYLCAIVSLLAVMSVIGTPTLFNGGLNGGSVFYSIWSELCFYFVGSSLLSVFESLPFMRKKWGRTARYSYAAVLVHPIAVIGIQLLCDGWVSDGVLKTIVVGSASVLSSWALGWGLVHIPSVARVL